MRMDREMGGCRSPRGVPRLPLGLLAVLALSVLAWAALPSVAASGGPRPFADIEGPVITSIAAPMPFVPDDGDNVMIRATAKDEANVVTAAEFFIDSPSNRSPNPLMMRPLNGTWASFTETAFWYGPYDFLTEGLAYGGHTLWVHARDAPGNWGPLASVPIFLYNPNATGPATLIVNIAPMDVAEGAPVTISAALQDWFRNPIFAAEFFVDAPGADGTGTPMTNASGAPWGQPIVAVTWNGTLPLSPGPHTVFVHGRSQRNLTDLWGAPATATLTSWSPAFTVRLLADRDTAQRGDVVTYTIPFENRGNAVASSVWVNLSLPATLSYLDDTSDSISGSAQTGTHFAFSAVAPNFSYSFTVRARVAATATDGLPLGASAALDYTNAIGWDFPAIVASATGSVIAPELAFSLSTPTVASAGDSVLLSFEMENSGVRTIPTIDITVTVPSWIEFRSDTSSGSGGYGTGPWAWRFTDIAHDARTFTVQATTSIEATDGAVLRILAHARYLSRAGSTADIAAEADMTISRPVFRAPTMEPNTLAVDVGGRASLSIRFANDGSAAARSVHLVVALPPGLARVGGDVPATARGGEYAWDFSSVAPGSYAVSVVFEGRSAGRVDVAVELTYTNPAGVTLALVNAAASIDVEARLAPATVASATLAASAISAALFVATERGKTAFLFLFLPLYTRLRHEKVLDHETRGMIRGYIVANPGDHYNAIKEALELPNGTLAYHIQVLQKEMIVKSVKDGKFRRFYPYEMRMPEGGQPTKIQRVILDLIRANPGITLRDAAGLLGLGSSTVSYHLERLEEIGRIEHRRDGISKRLYVKDIPLPT